MARRRDEGDKVGARRGFQLQQPPGFGGGGGEGGLEGISALMTLLGIGPKYAEEERKLGLDEMRLMLAQAEAERAVAESARARGLEERKFGLEEEKAREAATALAEERAARKETSEYQRESALRDIKAREDALEIARIDKIMSAPDTVISPTEKKRAIANASPTVRKAYEEEEAARKGTEVGKFKKGLEAQYKTGKPETVQKFLAAKQKEAEMTGREEGLEELLRDPSINWQALNAAMPAPQPGFFSRLFAPAKPAIELPANVDPAAIKQALLRTGYGVAPAEAAPPAYRYGVGEFAPPPAQAAQGNAPSPNLFRQAMDWWRRESEAAAAEMPFTYGRWNAPPEVTPFIRRPLVEEQPLGTSIFQR
jgi:hypothetical protein